jgi:hypothetical protein
MSVSAILALMEQLPTLLSVLSNVEPNLVKTYADLAHGEGGFAKVQKVVADLGTLFDSTSQAIGTPSATPSAPAA